MMAVLNAKEREMDDWQILLEKADTRFRYLGARKAEGSRLWIIEAEWQEAKSETKAT